MNIPHIKNNLATNNNRQNIAFKTNANGILKASHSPDLEQGERNSLHNLGMFVQAVEEKIPYSIKQFVYKPGENNKIPEEISKIEIEAGHSKLTFKTMDEYWNKSIGGENSYKPLTRGKQLIKILVKAGLTEEDASTITISKASEKVI